jgi:hypothetical protein
MKNRKHDYFDVVDTEYKAYILGFIYADGTVGACNGNRMKRLCITVQEEDGYILEKLGEDVDGIKVKLFNPPAISSRGWKKRNRVTISSDNICNKLISYGCKINKSRVGMDFPKDHIPQHLMCHFIRGFFDGDGSVTKHKDHYKSKTITSVYYRNRIALTSTSPEFLDDLITYLPIKKIYKSGRQRTMYVHTYWIERKEDVEAMFKYLYEDANYFLIRKKAKFLMSTMSQAVGTPTEGPETT